MDPNRAAMALYERLGWRRVATVDVRFPDGPTLPLHGYVGPPGR